MCLRPRVQLREKKTPNMNPEIWRLLERAFHPVRALQEGLLFLIGGVYFAFLTIDTLNVLAIQRLRHL